MHADFLGTLLVVTLTAGVVGLPVYLIVRFLRAYEQRTAVRADARARAERWAAMEARLEVLEAEVRELAEGQQFTAAVLAPPHSTALRKLGDTAT
jgi:hypothetical protein